MTKIKNFKDILGWREWIDFQSLKIKNVKAKVDTGARTSALHAEDIEFFKKNGKQYVRFTVHPDQKSKSRKKRCEAKLVETRKVKSSVGTMTKRPVIMTTISIGNYEWDIEITLVNRDIMGFRMLLGREAMRGHFLVDPGKSYVLGKGKSKTFKNKKIVKKVTK